MDYSTLAILLLLLGLALVVIEVFVPSGGMISIMAIVAVVASIWCAKKAWWDDNPTAWWTYIAAVLVLIPSAIGSAFYLFPKTSLGRKFLLEGPSLEEVTAYAEEEQRLKQLVGRHGTTLTLMNPGGLVLVDGERLHCESEGRLMLEPDVDVVVAAVKGNRLVVRPAPTQPEAIKPAFDGPTEVADNSSLDFDVPRT